MSSNTKLVNIKNFCIQVENFSIKNNVDICDEDFILKMIKEGYCFLQIPPSKIKNGLAQSRFRLTNGKHKESISILNSGLLKRCPLCEKIEQEEEEEYKLHTSDSE